MILFFFQYVIHTCWGSSKMFFSVWFQTKHQVGTRRWCGIFVAPHKALPCIWRYLSCNSSKLWIVSRVLPNQHVIRIQTKIALIFMETFLSEIDHRKVFMATMSKQMSNFKALWCSIHETIQYDEISFVLLGIFV